MEHAIVARGLRKRYGKVQALDGLDLSVDGGNGITGGELRRGVDRVLERFDLLEAADRPVRTYSGGMQRRLDVAMGLVHRPQVLFLDEPTTGLDPEVRAALWSEIERLARDEQMTILLTTHYLEEADRLASDLAIVDRGRVVAQGSPDALKSELQGDAVHVELAEPEPEARIQALLARVRELTRVSVDGRFVHTSATHGATAVPAVLAAFESSGVKVASVSMARPSLDEVYLRHAGRRFEDADLKEAA
jgi:ABC-2 type transport system ATP-binding protein